MTGQDLGQELRDLGEAVGLLDGSGNLQSGWFGDPITNLESILSNSSQRDAFMHLLDALLQPAQVQGAPADEKWHPLLSDQPRGNVYLTVAENGSNVVFGAAGEFHSTDTPATSLRARLPLVKSDGSNLTAVAGTSSGSTDGSLKVGLRVEVDLTDPIKLAAVDVDVEIAVSPSPSVSVVVTLEQLDLGDGPQNVKLDPENIGSEAIQLLIGLIKEKLAKLAGPDPTAQSIVNNLLQLFGYAGNPLPAFPFDGLIQDPQALQKWFLSMLGGSPPPIKKWLGYLAGLLGPSAPVVNGSGTPNDPFTVQVLAFGGAAESGLNLTLADQVTGNAHSLLLGINALFVPAGANPQAKISAQAILASIPLSGTAAAVALPSASVLMQAPGDRSSLVNDPSISIATLRAGLQWTGQQLQPLLELDTVQFEGISYPKLDLTNVNSVVKAASDGVRQLLAQRLSGTVGQHLAALVGLVAPANDPNPSTAPLLDGTTAALLASHPSRAIAQIHRAVLLDASTHPWSHMLEEIAALAGINSPAASGQGTQAQPWLVQLAATGSVTLNLAAWNAQTSGNAGDPQQLRIGLLAKANVAPLSVTWTAELLAADLPQNAEGSLHLLAGQHASLSVNPVPAIPDVGGIKLASDSLDVSMDWTPGTAIAWLAQIKNLRVSLAANTLSVGDLKFPPAAPFDFSNPQAIAQGLGITVPNLEALLRLLLARVAFEWGGMPGFAVAGLLGIHGQLKGLPADWPTLADPAAAGSLFTDPFSALRNWLQTIATQVSANGRPFLEQALPWLQTLLANELPSLPTDALPILARPLTAAAAPTLPLPITGSGVYDDPWALPLSSGASSSVDALVWLEAAGGDLNAPPPNWAATLAGAIGGAADFPSLITQVKTLAPFLPSLRNALNGADPAQLASSLQELATHLSTTDGVVPQASQVPTASNWTAGTALTSPHHLQPADPSAITQILTQIDTWAGGAANPRTVLLLGPPFSDHGTWGTLLSNSGLHGTSGQNFDLREAHADPTTIDLSKQVTQAVDYFTADLQDDGSGNIALQSAQIVNIVARIQQLRPGKVILVAHSTAGVAARAYTAANPTQVIGLITLGTPHLGAPLPFLTDSGMADAIRILQSVLPDSVGNDANLKALQHILRALDGYVPNPQAGSPPVANPYPYGSFNFSSTPSLDTGGCPALALGSTLTGPFLASLQQVLSTLATGAAAPNPAPPLPTHIAFGVRAHLGIPAPTSGQMAVDAWMRGDAFRVKLNSAAADPARAPHALQFRARLTRPGDWLVGEASPFTGVGAPQLDVRVRWAELGADIVFNTGSMSVKPHLQLHQVSYHTGLEDVVNFADTQAQALLGAVLHAVGTPPAGSPADNLITILKALGVAVDDSHGGVGISADAFSALTTDPAAFLGPKLKSALDGGLAGFTGPAGGPWSLPIPGLPLAVQVATGSWNIGMATPPAGLPLGDHASLVFNANLQLPNFQPTLTATAKVGSLSLTWDGKQLSAQAAPWLAPPLVLIPPPTPNQLLSRLNDILQRLLFSSAATALLQAVAGTNIDLPPLDTIFRSPGDFLKSTTVLGDGTQLLSARITSFLKWLNSKAGLPAGPGISLPAGFQLTSTGAGTDADPVRLVLGTTTAINNVVGVQLTAAIDKQLHVTPGGNVSLTITGLPGGPAIWTALTATFGASPAGATLSITPTPGSTIQVLPTFSGFDPVAAVESLLPAALDKLVGTLGASDLKTLALDVATALGVYDSANGFSAHTDNIKKLLAGDWTNELALTQPKQAQVAQAIASLFNDASSPLVNVIPDSITASGQSVVWKFDLSKHGGLGNGTVQVTLGWDGTGPTIQVGVTQLKVASAGLTADLTAGYASGGLRFSTALAVDLESSLGLDIAPKVSFGYTANRFAFDLLPLATSTNSGPATIHILPTPGIDWGSASPVVFVETWLLPLVGDLLLDAAQSKLSTPLWTGASLDLQKVLVGTGLIKDADPTKLVTPLPDMVSVVSGLLSTLATNVSVDISQNPKLTLSLVNDNRDGTQRLGIALKGSITFPVGQYQLAILFGAPSLGSALGEGAVLYLFNDGSFQFNPGLFAVGLGLGITGQDDAALVNTSDFRLGGVRGYVFFDCEFANGLDFSKFGAGLELDALGLPLGQATGGGVGGNPVAASLLKNNSGSGGDASAMNPGVDVAVWAGAPDDGSFHIKFGDVQDQPLWIGVHAGFGPIYIDQIGVELNDDGGKRRVGLLLDGSVKVNGLTAQVDELTLLVPLQSLTSPGDWSLDLKGLAVAFSSPGVTLAGGLLKNDTGSVVEYDGMLLIQISEFGFIAVGAYSTPTEGGDTYTSLFVFVAVFVTIGIPPLIEISGFGLGVGYNRELIVPDDLNQIPSFILIAALDDGGALANDPMGELIKMSASVPAKRGSFWLAVGLRGTSFQFVNVIAVVYVALDRGVEIGILGVARMALPTDDSALVEIELALKVRFSSSEGILSIQAQLTDHSWLLSSDCQLTGGFAYFMWFPKSQFLLSMGGYNPHFQKEPQYPDVPRLGYRWSLLGAINIKGESYFALTNSCVMVGTRMEATYGPDAIHVWFTAYADFLLSWDPFYYRVDIGVSVGATFSIRVCVFGCCIGIDITVSLGATLTVQGPPFHGSVSVDLAVATITIPFGPQPHDQPPALPWDQFSLKYIYGGDTNGYATATHVLTGLLPPVPAGGKPSPGTQDQPWKLSTEWSFQTETHMPAGKYTDFFGNTWSDPTQVHSIDIAPMYQSDVDSSHLIVLEALDNGQWVQMTTGAADERLLLRADHFTITPVIGQVSEATYHYVPPDQVPAAANTLPVITGVTIKGFAVPQNQSQLIPIAKLFDAGQSRPLPFEAPSDIDGLKFMGLTAEQLAGFVSGATTLATSIGAANLLSGSNVFSQLRLGAGLPEPGLGPMAVRALKRFRSAPPLLTPITTGLTMKPVGQPAPPVILRVPPVLPVHLEQPRLRVVLQARPQPVTDAPASLHTSVLNVNTAGAPRMAAPKLDLVAGAKLHRVAAPNAPRPTSLARPGRTLRHFDFGFASGKAHLDALTQAATDFAANGVAVAAGATHVWDVAPIAGQQIAVSGGGAARITFLAKNGRVLGDQEFVATSEITVPVPDKCFMVAVTCLGTLPDGVAAPAQGFGAVSWASSPQGSNPVVGWQSGNHVPQVGALSILTRGSNLTLSHQYVPTRGKHITSDAMVQISDALASQSGVETWLPPTVSVVAVLLDQQDADAVREGDLAIAVNGAALQVPPLRVTGGQRRALLYDVASRDPNIDHIVVAVGSEQGWSLAGVVGLSGQAQQWATRWNGSVPEHVVSDGPLTAHGSVTVRIVTPAGGSK